MTDKPLPSADDLRSALFDAYVAPHVEGATWNDPQGRRAAMLARLEQLKLTMGNDEAELPAEGYPAPDFAGTALSLLASDGFGWIMDGLRHRLLDLPCAGDEDAWKSRERELLVDLLGGAIGTPGAFGRALDVVPVLLPRWLAVRLQNNLMALDVGEIGPLLTPAGTGNSGRWTKNSRRLEVIERICYLAGQGYTIVAATEKLADLISVSVDTIDKWRSDLRQFYDLESLDNILTACKAAGEYKRKLANDPDHGKDPKNSVDAFGLQIFMHMEDEPLTDFARRFKRENSGEKAQLPRKRKPVKGTKNK